MATAVQFPSLKMHRGRDCHFAINSIFSVRGVIELKSSLAELVSSSIF